MFIQPEVAALLRRRIAQEGWAVAGVGTRKAASTYVYTAGLQKTFRHPDLIVFGVEPGWAQGVLDIVARRVQAGEPVHEGVIILGAAHACLMPRAADTARVEMFVPDQVARGRFDYLQIVWPDDKGRFPWERGFDRRRLRAQPLLFDIEGPP